MDVEQLRSRLRLLEDERAILGALHAYGHAIDYGDEERYLDLWTDDAAFDARGRVPGDVTRVVRGRQALADFAARFSRPPEGWPLARVRALKLVGLECLFTGCLRRGCLRWAASGEARG